MPVKNYPPFRQRPKSMAREIAKIVLDLREGEKLKVMSSNTSVISVDGGGGDDDSGAWKSATFNLPANNFTDFALFAIDATEDPMDYVVFLYGRQPNGTIHLLPQMAQSPAPGNIYWTWYNDTGTGMLTVRAWNGLENLEVRACVI